jgi:hypothetical protein
MGSPTSRGAKRGHSGYRQLSWRPFGVRMNILTGETDRDIRRYQYTYNADNIGRKTGMSEALPRPSPLGWARSRALRPTEMSTSMRYQALTRNHRQIIDERELEPFTESHARVEYDRVPPGAGHPPGECDDLLAPVPHLDGIGQGRGRNGDWRGIPCACPHFRPSHVDGIGQGRGRNGDWRGIPCACPRL